jgi:hypothetical protein
VNALVNCGKCQKAVTEQEAEVCWWCDGPLCYECWDRDGHCGHQEADTVNRQVRVSTPDGRAEILRAVLGEEGFLWRVRPEVH